MIDRAPHLAGALDGVVVEPQIDFRDAGEVVEPDASGYRFVGELQHALVPGENFERGLVVADARDTPPAGIVLQLQESHRAFSLYCSVPGGAPCASRTSTRDRDV
jgi:hypothetical protein